MTASAVIFFIFTVMKNWMLLIYLIFIFLNNCIQGSAQAELMPIAFPGAEGFGKYATGGRGGRVIVVNNLNDDGPGSFREAVSQKGKKIIVFVISGTIHLNSKLNILGDITIAGQTAPGDGICLADHPVIIGGNNVIIRYMRFRMGDKNQKGGMVDGNGGDDAFGVTKRKNIIIDHCSMSWSTDEVFSVYGGDSTTLQWNLITEPLNYSYHFETGDKDYERHGYGGIWGGKHLSAHHNLFANCLSRNPRFNGARLGSDDEFVDFRNNVIYNWEHNSTYGGEGGTYNMVNNYYKAGPGTNEKVRHRIVSPSKNETKWFGQFYVEGNYVHGAKEVTKNNWLGIDMGNGGTESDKQNAIVKSPFPSEFIKTDSPMDAYYLVTKSVGASFKRDTMDTRVIDEMLNNKGRYIDVQGGYPHGTAYEKTINAWPYLESLPALKDTDKDGMPDDWEIAKGLNPKDANDATNNKLHAFFTNIEVYINSLIK
jgi:pectate lyase